MKKILFLVVFLFLVACSNKTDENQETPKNGLSYCTRSSRDDKNLYEEEMTWNYEENTAKNVTITVSTTISSDAWVKDGEFTSDALTTIQSQFQMIKDSFKDETGITYEATTKANKMVETYKVDLSQITIERLVELGLYPYSKTPNNDLDINTIKTELTSKNFTCN